MSVLGGPDEIDRGYSEHWRNVGREIAQMIDKLGGVNSSWAWE